MNISDYFKDSVWEKFVSGQGLTLDFAIQAGVSMVLAVLLGMLIYKIYGHYYGGIEEAWLVVRRQPLLALASEHLLLKPGYLSGHLLHLGGQLIYLTTLPLVDFCQRFHHELKCLLGRHIWLILMIQR